MVKAIFPARIHKTQRLRVYVLYFSVVQKKKKKNELRQRNKTQEYYKPFDYSNYT